MQSKFEIDALDAAGRGLRAAFVRRGDRYDHAIVAVSPDGETPLLVAEELPLQEAVDHKAFDGSRAILLTGAGDGGYWSATVSAVTDVRLAILGFDWACRRKSNDGTSPAITYRLADGIIWRDNCLCLHDGRVVGIYGAVMAVNIATEFVTTCRVDSTNERVTLSTALAPHMTTQDTCRWRYEVRYVRQI